LQTAESARWIVALADIGHHGSLGAPRPLGELRAVMR